jgi:hypothetical protein
MPRGWRQKVTGAAVAATIAGSVLPGSALALGNPGGRTGGGGGSSILVGPWTVTDGQGFDITGPNELNIVDYNGVVTVTVNGHTLRFTAPQGFDIVDYNGVVTVTANGQTFTFTAPGGRSGF